MLRRSQCEADAEDGSLEVIATSPLPLELTMAVKALAIYIVARVLKSGHREALERAVLMFDESLYLAEADRILAVIMSMPADVEHLLVVGHNPGLSELAGGLAPGVAPRDLHTAGALTLRYKNVQGSDLRSDHVEQAQYYSPGQLGYA